MWYIWVIKYYTHKAYGLKQIKLVDIELLDFNPLSPNSIYKYHFRRHNQEKGAYNKPIDWAGMNDEWMIISIHTVYLIKPHLNNHPPNCVVILLDCNKNY